MKKKTQIETLVDEATELAQERDARAVADDLVRDLPPAFLRRIASQFLVERIRQHERRVTLLAERRAMKAQLMQEMTTAAPPPGRLWRSVPEERGWKPTPEQQAEMEEADRNARANMWARMKAIVDDYTEGLRMTWTQELLDSAFTLADGTVVLWGDATVDQHRERAALFMRNVAANAEGAARHNAAIRALDESGATCLREMVGTAA